MEWVTCCYDWLSVILVTSLKKSTGTVRISYGAGKLRYPLFCFCTENVTRIKGEVYALKNYWLLPVAGLRDFFHFCRVHLRI